MMIKVNAVSVLLFSFLLFSSFNLFAQLDFSAFNKKLDVYKSELGTHFSCVVQQEGKVLFKKETVDFDIKEPGALGSSSQWLTVALVMVAVDEGKISLDDYVGKYLPIFNTYGKKFITIRHCITHQTGIEAQKGIAKLFEKKKFESLEDEANAYASKREILYNPGVAFIYNNLEINLAARILEVAYKKGFEQLMNEKIIRPLGMKSTSFSAGNNISPASSCTASAADISNFLTLFLNKGIYNGKRILSEQSIKAMESLQMDAGLQKNLPTSLAGYTYGMGEWIMDKYGDGNPSVIGCINMFGCYPIIDKCRGYTLVIITKDLMTEQKQQVYKDLKNTLDAVLPIKECASSNTDK